MAQGQKLFGPVSKVLSISILFLSAELMNTFMRITQTQQWRNNTNKNSLVTSYSLYLSLVKKHWDSTLWTHIKHGLSLCFLHPSLDVVSDAHCGRRTNRRQHWQRNRRLMIHREDYHPHVDLEKWIPRMKVRTSGASRCSLSIHALNQKSVDLVRGSTPDWLFGNGDKTDTRLVCKDNTATWPTTKPFLRFAS